MPKKTTPTLAKPKRPMGIQVITRDVSVKPNVTRCFTIHNTTAQDASDLIQKLLADHVAAVAK